MSYFVCMLRINGAKKNESLIVTNVSKFDIIFLSSHVCWTDPGLFSKYISTLTSGLLSAPGSASILANK